MGAGASVKRSPTSLVAEIDRLRERELNAKEENVKQWDKEEVKITSQLAQLQSERNVLAQRLVEAEVSLAQQKEGWKKEKNKTMSLTYSSLPLLLLSEEDMEQLERKSNIPITKNFPMVTIAQSDVVGFSFLVARLKPHQVVKIIDHLNALMDEAYSSEDIFIMERNSDGCTAAAGLTDTLQEENNLRDSSLSLADSSYGSENNMLDFDSAEGHSKQLRQTNGEAKGPKYRCNTASHYADQMATAVLNLMSSSSRISIPLLGRKQLQLRVALHSGHCSAGVLGLQSMPGSRQTPQFKLLGPTVRHVNSLCRTGLALQIRVSRQCKDLLSHCKEFQFERCPDYTAWANRKPVESYWLVGKSTLPVKLPSLDLAMPLSEYEDIEI